MWTSFGRAAAIAAVSQWSAAADTLAMSSTEVDIGAIAVGSTITVKGRGKPVFIRHRSVRFVVSSHKNNNNNKK